MSGRMNWRRARLHGRGTLDHRYEFDPDYPDKTARWLRRVEAEHERRQQWQRAKRRNQQSGQYSMDLRRKMSTTANSSDVPW